MKPFIDPKTNQLEIRPAWADATLSFSEWEKQLDINKVISKLPLQTVDRELAKRALEVFGIKEGLEAIGISELTFPDFLRNKFELANETYGTSFCKHIFKQIFQTIDFGFTPLRLTAPTDHRPQAIWRDNGERPIRASLFDATFCVAPAGIASQPDYFNFRLEHSVPIQNLQLFIMDVPQTERDALRFHTIRDEGELSFLPDGGIAAVVFELHSDGFMIHGLHSPLIEACRDRGLREKYRDWYDILLAAFHYAVAQASALAPGCVPARVYYTDRAFPSDLMIPDRPILRMLVRPDDFYGYMRWWSKRRSDNTPFQQLLYHLAPIPLTNVREWERLPREILSRDLITLREEIPASIGAHRTFDKGARFATSHVDESIIHVPIQPLSRRQLSLVSQEAWEVHARELRKPQYAEVLKLIGPEFVPISKGVEAGARSDWWTMEREHRVDLMHLADQKRHPSLRFSMPNGERWNSLVVGIKGGGLRSLNDDLIAPPQGEWRFPAYVRRQQSSRDIVLSTHELWGGMQLHEAVGEFTTTLSFQAFLRRHRPEGKLPMATPIDVGVLHHVPLWNEDEVRWVSPIEFLRDHAQYTSDRRRALATFRSLGITEVRMLQLVDRVFLHERPQNATRLVLQEQIVSALRYLYAIHGESLVVPKAQLSKPGEAISPREVLRFLHAVYTSNKAAASRIRAQVAEPLVWAHGLMHRNGGDLGGLHIKKGNHEFGAFGGGPAALRNLSIAGEMRDIDTQIRVPNMPTSGVDSNGMYQMQGVRKQGDLVMLADSLYWLDKILFGEFRRDLAIPREIKTLTKINSFVRFGSDDSHLNELKLRIRDVGPHAIQLSGRDITPEDLLKGRDLEIYHAR